MVSTGIPGLRPGLPILAATVLVMFAATAAALIVTSAPAGAAVLGPHKGKVFTGVSDTGSVIDFNDFAETTGKHPAVLQDLPPLGKRARPRLQAVAERRGPADAPHLDRRRRNP